MKIKQIMIPVFATLGVVFLAVSLKWMIPFSNSAVAVALTGAILVVLVFILMTQKGGKNHETGR